MNLFRTATVVPFEIGALLFDFDAILGSFVVVVLYYNYISFHFIDWPGKLGLNYRLSASPISESERTAGGKPEKAICRLAKIGSTRPEIAVSHA